jgi:hypothetical protein
MKKQRLPVIGIDISQLMHVVDGVENLISPKDYTFGTDLPSRNIRAIYGNDSLNVGVVADVPKKPQSPPPPSAGKRINDELPSLPYKYLGSDGPLVEWDDTKKVLFLNQDKEMIVTHFHVENVRPKYVEMIHELYECWHVCAFSLDQSYEKANLTAKNQSEVNDDALNYQINKLIESQIASSALMIRHITGLDKLLDKYCVGLPEDEDDEED